MTDNDLKKSLDPLKPNDLQKERMKRAILNHSAASKASDTPVAKPRFNLRPFGTLAACLLVAVLLIVPNKNQPGPLPQGAPPQQAPLPDGNFESIPPMSSDFSPAAPSDLPQAAPPAALPQSPDQYFVMSGQYYHAVELSDFPAWTAVTPLGTLTEWPTDTEEVPDFSSTFGFGGQIWEIQEYPADFRVMLEVNILYYLCESGDS